MAGNLFTAALLILSLAIPALSNTPNGACVTGCFTAHPISSQCNGDETGDALANCTCASYEGGVATPMINCIKACPIDQQEIFVGNLPELCQNTVIPGVSAATSAAGSASTSSAAETSSASTASTTTAGTTTTGRATPTGTTSSSTTTSSAASKNAAMVWGGDAVKVGAFAGGVVALIL